MRKAVLALLTAAALGLASFAAPAPAEAASSRDILRGLAIGGAVVGGALLFGAAARAHLDPRYHSYAPATGYYYFPNQVYAAPPPVACPNGFWAYKVNKYGQPYGNPRWVCSPSGYYATHYVYR
jgi:hypothetical protein